MPQYLVGSGKDYLTISSAISAVPNNMIGTGIHEIIVDAGIYPERIVISNKNGNSSNYLWIHPAEGSKHTGNNFQNNGVRIVGYEQTDSNVFSYDSTSSYARFDELIISDTFSQTIIVHIEGDNAILNDFIVIAQHLSTGILVQGGSAKLNRCLVAGEDTTTLGYWFVTGSKPRATVYNCGVYSGQRGFYSVFSNPPLIINCWSYVASLGVFDAGNFIGSYDVSSSNNASNDDTVPGSNSLTLNHLSAYGFVNYTTSAYDYHILPTSPLNGAGKDLSSYFVLDIDGQPITNWPIGPDDPNTFISFSINKMKGTIPFYFRLTDESNFSILSNTNDYLRIWSLTNLRTNATEYFQTTSASVEYCISADSLLDDTYTVSLSAVF